MADIDLSKFHVGKVYLVPINNRKLGVETSLLTRPSISISEDGNIKERIQIRDRTLSPLRLRINSLSQVVAPRASICLSTATASDCDTHSIITNGFNDGTRSLTSFVNDLVSSDGNGRQNNTTAACQSHIKESHHLIDSEGLKSCKPFLAWLMVISMCFIYNAIVIPLRVSFPYQTSANVSLWMFFDYLCDALYLVDVFIVQPRLTFLSHGTFETSKKQLLQNYIFHRKFKLDVLSLLPLDFLYLHPSIGVNPLLRSFRLLKFQCYLEMFSRLDQYTKHTYTTRIVKSLAYLLYAIHINCCIFYAMSKWQGFGSTEWTYNGKGSAYIRCFYTAVELATLSGKPDDPINVIETFYMLISWMSGVFIISLLLGQIRDIYSNAHKRQNEFRRVMDNALSYCDMCNVPKHVRAKVREWFMYTWNQQKSLDETQLFRHLSHKLQIDLALSVHYETLRKVYLFQECEKQFLRELVIKLKPTLVLPGCFVCKKGELVKEMYIVGRGILDVYTGEEIDESEHLATLHEGSVFGEAGLLSEDKQLTKRKVDVVSRGYSNLFVLTKKDLESTLTDFPKSSRIFFKFTEKKRKH